MEQAERPQETSQSGGGTRVKYGLNLTGINPSHAVFLPPFHNPATGSQAPDCPQTHGVWPLAILPPNPSRQLRGTVLRARGPLHPCAGGDLRAMSSGPRGCWVPPSPLPPHPGQPGRGTALPGLQSHPPALAPATGTPRREGWSERRFGKISGLASFGDADKSPPIPTPEPGPWRGGLSPPPAARPAPSSRGQEPRPSGRARPGAAGIRCRLQLAVRRARVRSGRPAGRLLITRPPSPGSLSHGQPGAPARRGRRRPGREVGPSRARVAVPVGKGRWKNSLPPPGRTFRFAGGWGWIVVQPGWGTGRSHPAIGECWPGVLGTSFCLWLFIISPHPLTGCVGLTLSD